MTETALGVHDYAVCVGQELLARRAEGRSGPDLTHAAFLNGGLFPEAHHPLRLQRWLAGPLGPQHARLTGYRSEERRVG